MNRGLCLIAGLLADLGEITSGHLKNSGNTAAIRLSGTTALPTTNYIDFTATGTSPFIKHAGIEARANGDLYVTTVKVLGGGTAPSITTGLSTSRIGTGYSLTVAGKDTAGTITLTTGTGITTAVSLGTSMFVVTFGTAYAANPHGVVSSRNRFAADLAAAAAGAYFIDPITTDFSLICSKDVTFVDSTTYKWSYVVIG